MYMYEILEQPKHNIAFILGAKMSSPCVNLHWQVKWNSNSKTAGK